MADQIKHAHVAQGRSACGVLRDGMLFSSMRGATTCKRCRLALGLTRRVKIARNPPR